MSEKTCIPDWTTVDFGVDRFEVIHDLLNQYERKINESRSPINREPFLAHCESEYEREIMIQEMDYLDELKEKPVKFIGGYLVERAVAFGGFGIVFLAYNSFGDRVAIKVPHFSWQVAQDREQLESEAVFLGELEHPNIVEFIESGYDECWYLVTEWIDGHNLAEALEGVRAPLHQWLSVFIQVCDAVAFGHKMGVVHRDIKPRNIMVHGDEKPVAKVLDYGIAKRTGGKKNSRLLKGTCEYMAPERYFGQCDERSDIYSLGITFREVIRAQFSSLAGVPKPLRRIINKATAKKPRNRYQTVEQMSQDIDAVYKTCESGEIEFRKPAKRKVLAPAVAAASLLACCVLISFWFDGKPGAPVSDADSASTTNDDGHAFKSHSVDPGKDKSKTVAADSAFEACFDIDGKARVTIQTQPESAVLTAYRLGKDRPERRAAMGLSSSSACLEPGDYLIVAEWENGDWTEVLRRVPGKESNPVPPFSTFDSFVKKEGVLQLASIIMPSKSIDGMVELDGFLIDFESQVVQVSNKGTSTFAQMCNLLEQEGKRPPTMSEIVASRKSAKVQSSSDEWTCSLAAENKIRIKQEAGRDVFVQHNSYVVIPADLLKKPYSIFECPVRASTVEFRGVRSASPFGVISK